MSLVKPLIMRRPRPHKFIEVWVLFYLWLKPSESPLLFVLIPHFTCLPPLNFVGTLLGKSWDLAAVAVYHQGRCAPLRHRPSTEARGAVV